MDWDETSSSLDKLHKDLSQCWEYLRAIAKHETFTDSISTEKKMKSAQFLTEAAERLKVLEVVNKRVINRFRGLLLFMGMAPNKAESQKVSRIMILKLMVGFENISVVGCHCNVLLFRLMLSVN